MTFDTNQYWIDLVSEKEAEIERLHAALLIAKPYMKHAELDELHQVNEALASAGRTVSDGGSRA